MDRLTGNSSAVNFMLGLFWHQPLAPARLEELGEKIGEGEKKGGGGERLKTPHLSLETKIIGNWKLERFHCYDANRSVFLFLV